MGVIIEISAIYYEGTKHSNYLRKAMEYKPKIKVRGEDIKFQDRSFFHKIARVIYVCIRSLYIQVIFYLFPLIVIYLMWILPLMTE